MVGPQLTNISIAGNAMNTYENIPATWFTMDARGRSPRHTTRMSRPVSKSFNRISDFIFPDSIRVQLSPHSSPKQRSNYDRIGQYTLPALNRSKRHQPDLIIVERLSSAELDNIDLLYRERNQLAHRQFRRRYSSIVDDRQVFSHEATSPGIITRPAAFREKIRDRRKRHTMDNVYHSMLKSMLDSDGQKSEGHGKKPSYILSYRTTLDPITDSESMTSLHQQRHVNEASHGRVPLNGTAPTMTEYARSRRRHCSSTGSSEDSFNDSDATERPSLTISSSHKQQTPPCVHPSEASRTLRKRLSGQPNGSTRINSSSTTTDKNNSETAAAFDHMINYQRKPHISSQDANHVSVCVNDLHTTLFIDEDTLNNTKTPSNGGKAVIKTFIDRIIKRLQHFKRSLDHGLIHVRKRNTLVNGSIVTTNYQSRSEMVPRKTDTNFSWTDIEESKHVRPYFLIKPQTVLMLPNETAKFKCCFGGDPFPTIIWSHNDSRIAEIVAARGIKSSRYRIHKLHDIHYLDIDSLTIPDNGQIKCTIMNKIGQEEAIVQLLVVPSPADATPCITEPLTDISVKEGQPLKVSCVVNGLQVTVNWFHNGKVPVLVSNETLKRIFFSSLHPRYNRKTIYHEESVMFNLTCCIRDDAGSIDCVVKNRFGEVRTSCRVEVVNDPEVDQ